MAVQTKRIYEPAALEDGFRLLVMRRWPRGIAKDRVDAWERALAPSVDLLADFRSGAVPWAEYTCRYLAEMRTRPDAVVTLEALRRRAQWDTVTLLCACKETSRCHRTLLQGLVEAPSP